MVMIGIDCEPGSPRPDTFIKNAVDLIKSDVIIEEPVNKFFGAWTWNIAGISDEEYTQAKPRLEEYFDRLYMSGRIRGAEWGLQEK